MAIKLVDIAKKSGADAIKFQIFIPEDVVTPSADTAKYAIKNMRVKKTIRHHKKILSYFFATFETYEIL